MGYPSLPKDGSCSLIRGCVPSKAYNIVAFKLGNKERTTIGVVSGLGLITVIARMTSTEDYMLRPTDRARERVGRRRLLRTNMRPSLVHFDLKVRGVRSLVTSMRRTLRSWCGWRVVRRM